MGVRPDWVMVGMPQPGGKVWLIASKDMNEAELRAEIDRGPDLLFDSEIFPGQPYRHEYTLTASMRRFTLIEAADYPAAFRALFEQWTPEPAAGPAALPAGPPELTG